MEGPIGGTKLSLTTAGLFHAKRTSTCLRKTIGDSKSRGKKKALNGRTLWGPQSKPKERFHYAAGEKMATMRKSRGLSTERKGH